MFKTKEFEFYFERLIANSKWRTLPELISRQTGHAFNGRIRIFYEKRLPTTQAKGTILLISRNAETMLFWPEAFLNALVDAGFEVVRFDHRGLGLSDWIRDSSKKKSYTLENMARDAMAVVDHLKVKKVHVIGASMGGMIAQRMAIDFPNVVASLTSIMSSGFHYDPQLTAVSKDIKQRFFRIIFSLGNKPFFLIKF